MSRTSNERAERRRRHRCRERAKIRLHVLNNGRRDFPGILAAIRRRWPVSAAGDDFAAELRQLFDAEQAERETRLRERARRLFDVWNHPRWSFERLEKCIRLRRPKLAKNPIVAAELRRLYDAGHGADLQPQDIGPETHARGPRVNATRPG